METFTWKHVTGAKGAVRFRTLKAQFGDGYAQEVEDGINNEVQSWPLTFIGRRVVIEEIVAFLRRHPGAKAFRWTPPFGAPGFYTAGAFEPQRLGATAAQLSVTFQQVFRP